MASLPNHFDLRVNVTLFGNSKFGGVSEKVPVFMVQPHVSDSNSSPSQEQWLEKEEQIVSPTHQARI